MRALPGLLLRFACSLALMLAAWPIRAGVVCVSEGHVIARCARACCPAKAKTHCETVYRKGVSVVTAFKAKTFVAAILPTPTDRIAFKTPAATRIAWSPLPDPPLLERPRPPDRGRAPPRKVRSLFAN